MCRGRCPAGSVGPTARPGSLVECRSTGRCGRASVSCGHGVAVGVEPFALTHDRAVPVDAQRGGGRPAGAPPRPGGRGRGRRCAGRSDVRSIAPTATPAARCAGCRCAGRRMERGRSVRRSHRPVFSQFTAAVHRDVMSSGDREYMTSGSFRRAGSAAHAHRRCARGPRSAMTLVAAPLARVSPWPRALRMTSSPTARRASNAPTCSRGLTDATDYAGSRSGPHRLAA